MRDGAVPTTGEVSRVEPSHSSCHIESGMERMRRIPAGAACPDGSKLGWWVWRPGAGSAPRGRHSLGLHMGVVERVAEGKLVGGGLQQFSVHAVVGSEGLRSGARHGHRGRSR